MNFSFNKRKIAHLYLTYTLAFITVAIFVYGTYLLTGHSLIWHLDGANQHLPLLEQYRSFLLDFLKNPSAGLVQWSWHFGLGSDTFQVYSYYTIGDVFAYLALLFPASKVALAYQLTIVLRLYCAGLSFCFLAKHFDFDRFTIVGGAMVYLFNAFLLYSNVAQPFFTTPFILFPLIIVALERVFQKRSILPLILVFSWMLISSFYFAYVLGIGAMIYVALRFFLYYKKRYASFKEGALVFFNLVFAAVISLLCASIMLLPEILAVKNSTRTGGVFANGLTFYPPYYYLALPSQLINGGNRDFYFWSALGFASIVFFAIVYIIQQRKKYPLLCLSFIISFVMLLLPFFGAFFNGMMSPSNRWTLLSCLPVSLAVCILLKHARQLSEKTLKIFSFSLFAYVAYICLTYFFENDEKVFIPVIFLFIFWGSLIALNTRVAAKLPRHLLFLAIILNVCLNAVYFEAPYNGGYADEMLPLNSYENLKKNRFANLDQNLPDPNTDFYRVSTISKNYYLGADYHLYNLLASKLYQINSYYSLQNKALGEFSKSMQNSQYEANIPLGQVSDRTILNNFLGVRYLFTKINQPNDQKIPYGYDLAQVSQRKVDPNGKTTKDQQTQLYQTSNAFPLVYFQTSVISSSAAKKMSATQRERALATSVVVDDQTAKDYTKATLATDEVIEVPYYIVSSRGNIVDPADLNKQDADETYKIVLQDPEQYGAGELHLEFSNIKYTPYTLRKQLKLESQNASTDLTQGLLDQNKMLTSYKYFRYHVLQGSPDSSFGLTVTSSLGSERLFQPKQNALSFYKTVTSGTLNSGYFKELPQTLTLEPSKLGNYQFKLKIYVEKLGATYDKQVSTLQKNALQNLKFINNGLTGQITVNKNGILTSSIPYSSSWTVYVDGKAQKVLETNQGFVGIRLSKGSHQIKFVYHIPGVKTGAFLSLSGLILLLAVVMFTYLKKRQLNKKDK